MSANAFLMKVFILLKTGQSTTENQEEILRYNKIKLSAGEMEGKILTIRICSYICMFFFSVFFFFFLQNI